MKLPFWEHRQVVNKNGYEQQVKVYESESCQGCPVFEACRGQKANKASNRRIQVNENLEAHRAKAKQLLESEEGKEKRVKRGVQVETPFGNIKFNMGHER